MLPSSLAQLTQLLDLSPQALQLLHRQWWPLASSLAVRNAPKVLGINGAQGSGKSTLVKYLQAVVAQEFGLQVAILSLDDLYYPKPHRRWLAAQVHPLLATRGVPGTHDINLGMEIIRRFRAGLELNLPRFDKATDDRALEGHWLQGPVDILILEGWCLGALPQSQAQLKTPVNELEENEDSDGSWRQYVNTQLAGEYQRLFAQLDKLLVLQAPDWQSVQRWRAEQEQKLIARRGQGMSKQALARFMQHYQRLTCHQLHAPPPNAQLYLLDPARQVQNQPGQPSYDWQI
ncbi:kinase [Bowmanella denitrificans]|uniref:Kinase n=1 Tax=Bowmanella denitrificans TaxID=366582 RepID=A0ABP3HKX8_9ALTE